jgi:hypothetical protein
MIVEFTSSDIQRNKLFQLSRNKEEQRGTKRNEEETSKSRNHTGRNHETFGLFVRTQQRRQNRVIICHQSLVMNDDQDENQDES